MIFKCSEQTFSLTTLLGNVALGKRVARNLHIAYLIAA